eukprot:12916356-Prorocentrum_lima.AAC.1
MEPPSAYKVHAAVPGGVLWRKVVVDDSVRATRLARNTVHGEVPNGVGHGSSNVQGDSMPSSCG